MKQSQGCLAKRGQQWYSERDCSLNEFVAQLNAGDDCPTRYAAEIRQGIPVYDCQQLDDVARDASGRAQLQAEWACVLRDGAGVLLLQQAFADIRPIDDATAVFAAIIRSEREQGSSGADHFAAADTNDRIWNAQEKLCLRAPAVFAEYFSNLMLRAVSEAWLGPCYQMTSQVNVVRPGGDAQKVHRDYHLGFQTVGEAERYPVHVHRMSAFLTLQGAVAHTDMPVESGPTKLLPYSQRYAEGYVAWRRADFREYFEEHFVQLPLSKGDVVFFNPALFHAAGANRTTDVQRMANLLQISSAYGRAMEVLDRRRMCEAVYPVLRERRAMGRISDAEAAAAIASCAEGYPFPTDLDRNPPVGGLAPESQQELMQRALDEDWEPARFIQALNDQASRSRMT
ncbi:phytanoyl-CoA dioxygenase family protein [Paraburkholderia sp. USG1]|uniref:phytanoyl-CoA dioxygenase family protein n=1 Tax=Paraburkholderia sp. USG1 TaxID=2952268 RepID=UPI00285AA442|nr:phytanoyl-CoA dioxygenase family protein [Paraburkholderia sp. USG1]MDR8396582.1 phytanoyl-CoA dioxygenase family protein [Paraburkholderia sp. USG1]